MKSGSKIIFAFTAALILGSCTKHALPRKDTQSSRDTDIASLQIDGPATINAAECVPYEISLRNSEGEAVAIAEETLVALEGEGFGSFYFDLHCIAEASEAILATGSTSTKIYYLNEAAEKVSFSASVIDHPQWVAYRDITVLPVANLALSDPPVFDFGTAHIGQAILHTFVLTNEGSLDARNIQAQSPNTPFIFDGGTFPGTGGTCQDVLPPEESCTLRLRFTPTNAQTFAGEFKIFWSDGGSEHEIVKNLIGKGTDSGNLETTFGQGGLLTLPLRSRDDRAFSVTTLADGKALVAGSSESNPKGLDFAVVRLTEDGSLDGSFGSGGKTIVSFSPDDDQANALALQSDRKIILAGHASIDGRSLFALLRLEPNGGLDPSFGDAGKVTTPVGNSDAYVTSVAIQSNNSIVVAGYAQSGTLADVALVRYQPEGSLDPGFGNQGKVIIPASLSSSYATKIVIQGDGKIIVAGYATRESDDFLLIRLQPDGSLDRSFGNNGFVFTDIQSSIDHAYGVALQKDGKVVTVGSRLIEGRFEWVATRHLSNGNLDRSMNRRGIVTIPMGNAQAEARSVDIQPDGRLLLSGFAVGPEGTEDFAVVRLTASGEIDRTFGENGKALIPMGTATDRAYDAELDAWGRIVVAGDTFNGLNYDFAVLRLLP